MADKESDIQPGTGSNGQKAVQSPKRPPVRIITIIVLVISLSFFTWYVLSDRHAPYTDQARFNGLMIPVTSQVSGDIIKIYVKLHSSVKAGDTLFRIDPRPFLLAVEKSEANVDNTAQSVAAKTASVKSAAGRLGVTKAQLDRATRNWDRVQKVMKENNISLVFLPLLTLLAGLLFANGVFSSKPAAPLFGMAFSTFLLILGNLISIAGEAGEMVWVRILQIGMAMIYMVIAFGVVEHLTVHGRTF